MVSVVRCGHHLRIFCKKNTKRQHLDSVVVSTRSMVLDEISSEKRRENCVCVRFWKSVHEPSVAIRSKSDAQVDIRANRQSRPEMGHGIWVGKAPMTDEHTIHTENGVQKARSLHLVPPEERFVISESKTSLERQGGKLESDDCDATGPRPIWTSTCVLDDLGRSKEKALADE